MYTPKLRVLSLSFVGTEYAGMEISMKAPTLGEWTTGLAPGMPMTDDELITLFVEKITSWNLDNGYGDVLSISEDSLRSLDLKIFTTILTQYSAAIRGVDEDLGKDSTGGENLVADSIPMEAL